MLVKFLIENHTSFNLTAFKWIDKKLLFTIVNILWLFFTLFNLWLPLSAINYTYKMLIVNAGMQGPWLEFHCFFLILYDYFY